MRKTKHTDRSSKMKLCRIAQDKLSIDERLVLLSVDSDPDKTARRMGWFAAVCYMLGMVEMFVEMMGRAGSVALWRLAALGYCGNRMVNERATWARLVRRLDEPTELQ